MKLTGLVRIIYAYFAYSWLLIVVAGGAELTKTKTEQLFSNDMNIINDYQSSIEECSTHNHECTDEIVVKLSQTDAVNADSLADKHGYVNLGQVGSLTDYYLFKRKDGKRRKREIFTPLMEDSQITWAEPQFAKKRVKRDFQDDNPRNQRESSVDTLTTRASLHLPWPDPLYSKQWYLRAGAVGGYDMRVREAWNLGYSGIGIVTSILDDGIQGSHPDLVANYDPLASKDINDNDDDPTPRDNGENKHGTRCAGEVSAMAGNNWCGVGIAYNSKIGGVRMLDGPVSDRVEGAALSHQQNHIDIYSASWGPDDDGQTFDGPGRLAKEAFFKGVREGRRGRGNIFIWASGNGGSYQDSCSCDGYTTSIYTLSVSSATFDNHRPWYLEECPSTLTTTYSSANRGQPAIVSTDMPNSCTDQHTGTSASAPNAAGIVALALEANGNLTWRDMQHLVVRTSNSTPLLDNPGWSKNGVGRMISNKFGYGLMNAEALVKLAIVWKTVPPQRSCTYAYKMDEPKQLREKFSVNYTLDVGDCVQGPPVLYLEHVQAVISIQYKKRGDLQITLYSPAGTKSVLLPPRPRDDSAAGLQKWPFLSVQQWGENPRGTWTMTIENVGSSDNIGVFQDWSMTFYGTDVPVQPNDPPVFDGSAATSALYELENDSSSTGTKHEVEFPRQAKEPLLLSNDYNTPIEQHRQSQRQQISGGGYVVAGANGEGVSRDMKILLENCHSECASDGCYVVQSAFDCVTCKNYQQFLRNRGGKKCVNKCDSGYYADDKLKRCNQCLSGCASCSGPNYCDTCLPGTYLVDIDPEHFHHGRCAAQCPEGFVATNDDSNIKKCLALCGVNCFTCDSTNKICRYCKEHFYMTSAGQCVAICPDGFFANGVYRKCEQCVDKCSKCSKSDVCDSCSAGFVWNSTLAKCLISMPKSCSLNKDCPNGQYCESSDNRCRGCHTDCTECVGPSFDQCTTCSNGQPLDSRTRQCMPCHAGQYFNSDSLQCVNCENSCAVCVGPGRTQCTKCKDGYRQIGMICERCCSSNDGQEHKKLSHCINCLEESSKSSSSFDRYRIVKVIAGVVIGAVVFCLILMAILMFRDRNYVTGARKYAYSKLTNNYETGSNNSSKVLKIGDEKYPIVNSTSVQNGGDTNLHSEEEYLDNDDEEDTLFSKEKNNINNIFNGASEATFNGR